MDFKRLIISIINYTKFMYFLCRGIFGSNSPEVILKMIKKFVTLEAPFYPNTLVMNRSIYKSTELLCALIDSYLVTKSEVTLEQVLAVLKEEFIKREQNGRKQF